MRELQSKTNPYLYFIYDTGKYNQGSQIMKDIFKKVSVI